MSSILFQSLKGRTVLLANLEKPMVLELISILQKAGCNYVLAPTFADAQKYVQSQRAIECAVLGISDDILPGALFLRFCAAERRSDLNVLLISPSENLDSTMAYYEGAQAVFSGSMTAEEVARNIALCCISYQSVRQTQRKRLTRAWVTYSLNGTQYSGYGANISTGGMFVGTAAETPAQEQEIEFKALIGQDDRVCLEGNAVVKWVRDSNDNGKPRGFGLKFENLNSESANQLERIIAEV